MKGLIIVDMQNDFLPGGALPTKGGDLLIPTINALMEKFPVVLATKDWHPSTHISFAANHAGKKIGEKIPIEGGEQILWPIHCVQNTWGGEFAKGLNKEKFTQIFYKGIDPQLDSYSAFFDNAKKRSTGLEEYLRKHQIDQLFFVGVATDYCVLYSVLDALELGFDVSVISDCCRPINLDPDDEQKALDLMKSKGAKILLVENVE